MKKPNINYHKMVGKKFNSLTVLSIISEETVGKYVMLKVKCVCGNEKEVQGYKVYSGRAKSCGCMQGLKQKVDYLKAVKKFAFTILKCQAKDRGLENTLPLTDFIRISEENCTYCGAEPSNDMGVWWRNKLKSGQKRNKIREDKRTEGVSWLTNGLDRVDSSKGYVLGNVVACCKDCNRAKSDMTTEKFMTWLDKLANNSHKSQSTPL